MRVVLVKAKQIARFASLGLAILVGACGGSSSGSGSFVGTASNAAVLVQWTRDGSQLTRELQQATLQDNSQSDSANPESVSNDSVAFTGTVSGSGVTLSLNQGLGSVNNLTGTLNGGELDLNFPGQNGGITTVALHSGNASAFNQAVASLQNQASQANIQVQQQAQAQAQAQSVANDASAVSQDLGNLKSAVSGANGTSSLGSDLNQTKTDLATTLTDEQKVLGEAGGTDSGTSAQMRVKSLPTLGRSKPTRGRSRAIRAHHRAIRARSLPPSLSSRRTTQCWTRTGPTIRRTFRATRRATRKSPRPSRPPRLRRAQRTAQSVVLCLWPKPWSTRPTATPTRRRQSVTQRAASLDSSLTIGCGVVG